MQVTIQFASTTLPDNKLCQEAQWLRNLLDRDRQHFRVESGPAPPPAPDPAGEARSPGVALTAILVAFLQTGAAKALVEAVRALFGRARDTDFEITITPPGAGAVHIKGTHFTKEQADALIRLLEKHLTPRQPSKDKGPTGRGSPR
jgi:hypothetical protein